MSELDIGEVVRQSGLPASTLRFYEEKGLISPVRRSGLRRVYGANVLQRLGLIALGRTAGFSLDEIAAMLTPQGAQLDRALLMAKADELDGTIRQLSAVRDGLRHAAECRAPSHMECPTFQRIVRSTALSAKRGAGSRARQPRRRQSQPNRCIETIPVGEPGSAVRGNTVCGGK